MLRIGEEGEVVGLSVVGGNSGEGMNGEAGGVMLAGR
jgi:hypothetical protein